MSASAAGSVFASVCTRSAGWRALRRNPRRRNTFVPKAVPSDETTDVASTKEGSSIETKPKAPPSVIVGGFFVADSKPTQREGSKNRARGPGTDSETDRRNRGGATETSSGADRDRTNTWKSVLPIKKSKTQTSSSAELAQRENQRQAKKETTAVRNEAIGMWFGAACLGPLLDHQHSRFDVLHYVYPFVVDVGEFFTQTFGATFSFSFLALPANAPLSQALTFVFQRETWVLETAWWVPLLFGGAGAVIGLGHTVGDSLMLKGGAADEKFEGISKDAFFARCPGKPVTGWEPGAGAVSVAISAFALQYFASGVLGTSVDPPFPDLPRVSVDLVLFAWGFGSWYFADRTVQGLAMAVTTAVAGPVTEICIINITHLYSYTSPDFFGIPSWIVWVYFGGSPAVGLLSRFVRAEIRKKMHLPKPVTNVLPPPRKKQWRPPPRGFQAEGVTTLEKGTEAERAPRGKLTVVMEEITKLDVGRNDARTQSVRPETPWSSEKQPPSSATKTPGDARSSPITSRRKEKRNRESLTKEITALQKLKGKLASLRDSISGGGGKD
jgi:hypothetical protein